jgi:hypothetical protein
VTGSAQSRPDGAIDRVVRWTIVPVANAIAYAATKGILFVAFAGLWLLFGAAVLVNPNALTDTLNVVGGWPLMAQAVAWLLFLPLMVGLWIWQTDWPLLVRLALIVALAAWNLLVFMPRRAQEAN